MSAVRRAIVVLLHGDGGSGAVGGVEALDSVVRLGCCGSFVWRSDGGRLCAQVVGDAVKAEEDDVSVRSKALGVEPSVMSVPPPRLGKATIGVVTAFEDDTIANAKVRAIRASEASDAAVWLAHMDAAFEKDGVDVVIAESVTYGVADELVGSVLQDDKRDWYVLLLDDTSVRPDTAYDRAKANPLLASILPKQSYEFAMTTNNCNSSSSCGEDESKVQGSESGWQRSMMCHYHADTTRRDRTQSFDPQQCASQGALGCIHVSHVLPEVLFKLGLVGKYGA